MAKIFCVSNNQGGTNVVLPVVKLARTRRHDVFVAAGGVGLESYDSEHVFVNHRGLNMKGLTARPEGWPSQTASGLLRGERPDVVLLGQSSPPDWEVNFGLWANALNIPVMTVNDFWAGASRLQKEKVKPNLIGVLDEYDQTLCQKLGNGAHTTITGNPGVKQVTIPTGLKVGFAELRQQFTYFILFVGTGPEETTEELVLLLECLELTPEPGRFGLITRFHPKYSGAKNERGKPWADVWAEMLKTLGDRCIRIGEPYTIDELSAVCDVTCSAFSTVNTTAVCNGRSAISFWTEMARESLSSQVGLDHVPLVALGCAHQIHQPESLTPFLMPCDPENLRKLIPYNPERVLAGMLELVA